MLFIFLLATTQVIAQNPPSNQIGFDQEEILRREQRRELERLKEFQEKGTSTTKIKEIPKLDETKDQACFKFQTIELKGADSLSQKEKFKLTNPYLNRCLNVAGINNLLREITNYYIQKGFITTRAFMANQDISDGSLLVLVVEAMVKKLNLIENGKPRKSGKNAFPKTENKHLNIRKLEQGIDQINRLNQFQAKIDIKPSENSGETDVVVNTQTQGPAYLRLTYDNYGQSTTGKDQFDMSFGFDDLFGAYENIFLSLRNDGDFHETDHFTRGVSGGFSIPFGYWTLNGSASYFKYFDTIESTNQSFESKGISRNYRLDLNRVLQRSTDTKTSLSFWASVKDSDNYIEGVRLDTSSRRLSHLGLTLSHLQRLWGGSLSANLGYERGVRFLGALKDPSSPNPNNPVAQSEKYTISLNYYKPLNPIIALSFQASGQWSPDTLFGTERFGIGGVYSVRGFRDQSIVGDRGGYLRSEFIQYLPMLQNWGRLQSFLAYDIGWIEKDEDDAFERGNLQAVAAGLKLFGTSYQVEISLEKNINRPDFITEDTSIYRLRLSKTF